MAEKNDKSDYKTAAPICKTKLGELYNLDALEFMDQLKAEKIRPNMIFADPPYNIGKAEWDKTPRDEYLKWTRKWVKKASEILQDNGSLFIMGFSEILADIKYLIARDCQHLNSLRWLVWHYRNKPSLSKRDWVRSHESILHFRKGRKFLFNADLIREPYNVHTLKYPARGQAKTSQYGNGKDYIWKPNAGGSKPRDVIIIPTLCAPMSEKTSHPTQKPEELLRKLVLSSTKENNLVLDPFVGSGTTPVVCEQLRRRWIGTEIDQKYCNMAIRRLKKIPKDLPLEYWLELDRKRVIHRAGVRGRAL